MSGLIRIRVGDAGSAQMRSIKNYAIPLAFASIGFLIGIYWSNLSPLIKLFFSSISNGLAQLDILSQSYPIVSGLAFAVIVALIVPVTRWIRNLTRSLVDRPTMIDIIFKYENNVHAIISHMTQKSFKRIGCNKEVILPENALFLPSAVAMGIVFLYDYFQKRYGDLKTAEFHYDHNHWKAQDHNFICVGGPFVNPTVKYILDLNMIPDFSIDDIPTALDQGDPFKAERENASTAADAPLSKDYGFIIFMNNPWNPDKKICILFGLWPQGTQAAVETILARATRFTYFQQLFFSIIPNFFGRRLNKSVQLYRALKKGRNVIGVVEVAVAGLLASKAKLVKVRTF